MTNEEIIKALRVCGKCSCTECLIPDHDCGSLCVKAGDAIEDLQQLADNIEKERRCLEEEVRRLNEEKHQSPIELACKKIENEILRGELRRMFQLYVAAEMRAGTGVNTDELDDEADSVLFQII